jgi:DNA mismatch repair protein MutS2
VKDPEPGDEVVVIPLNRRGRVVDVQGTRYRVAVGALTVSAALNELRPPEGKGRKRARGRSADHELETRTEDNSKGSTRRIDLHGMTVEQAREAVLSAVNDAALAGDAVIEVVHGIGTGRVREAVWRELKRLSIVRHVAAHPTNRGVTVVRL